MAKKLKIKAPIVTSDGNLVVDESQAIKFSDLNRSSIYANDDALNVSGSKVLLGNDMNNICTTATNGIQINTFAVIDGLTNYGYYKMPVNDGSTSSAPYTMATKEYVDNQCSAIPKYATKVVTSLPTTNIETATVYLVKSSEATGNLYSEYIYVDNK